MVLIATALAGVATGYMLYTSTRPQPPAQPTDVPSLISAGPVISIDLNIEADSGDSVTLTWTDPTGGQQSYVAVQFDPDTDKPTSQVVQPGGARKSATFTGLANDRDYCFQVVVIVSATEQGHSPRICTTRG